MFSDRSFAAINGERPLAHSCTLPLLLGVYPPPRMMRRRCRRPFTPRQTPGPYRFPKGIQERLAADLAAFRNAESAFTLALFLARFWSAPTRLEKPFPIDRRALASHCDLALSEAKTRGAIKTLEEIGYLERLIPENGSRHRRTETGLRRKPIQFRFGTEYRLAFNSANKRAEKPRGRDLRARRTVSATPTKPPPMAFPAASPLKSPKNINPPAKGILMGELKRPPEKAIAPSAPNPALEAAIEKWRIAIQEKG